MAGKSQRFLDAGYSDPKFLLPIGKKSILEYIIDTLPLGMLITIAMAKYKGALCSIIHCDYVNTIWLLRQPNGPLSSVLCAEQLVNSDELLINYCDNFLSNQMGTFIAECRKSDKEAGIVVVEGNFPKFTLTPSGNLAGGIYWFRDGSRFIEKAKQLTLSDKIGIPDVVYSFGKWYEFVTDDLVNTGTPELYDNALSSYHSSDLQPDTIYNTNHSICQDEAKVS